MPKAERVSRAEQRQILRRDARLPDFLAVRLVISTHAANTTGKPCPDCGSELAAEVAREHLDTRLIETATQRSWIRSRVKDSAKFDDLAKPAKWVDLVVRCTADTRDVLTDFDTTVTLFIGGARSGKTSENAGCSAIRWFYRGAPERQFWCGGPTVEKSHVFLHKLFTGEGQMPPLFPPDLVLSCPRSAKQPDQTAEMVDGSVYHFRHTRSADKWKGEPPVDVRITEAGEVRDKEVLTEARVRIADFQGQVGLDSTPVMGSHLHELYKDAQAAAEDAKQSGTRPGIVCLERSSSNNPWISREFMEALRADIARTDPQQARRTIDGEWASDHVALFSDVWDETDGSVESFFQDPRDIPKALIEIGRLKGQRLEDVTKLASRRFFYTAHDWVIGVDANYAPHTALVCKVVAFGPPSDQKRWGLLVWDEVRTNRADTLEAASNLLRYEDGLLRGQGVSIDASEDYDKSYRGGKKGVTGVMDYRSQGFNAKPCNKTSNNKAKNPKVDESTRLVKYLMRERLLLVNGPKCAGLLRALREQEDRGDGRPKDPKASNTWTDREIYAYTDALRYVCWPLFRRIVEQKLVGSTTRIEFQ